MKEDGLEHNCPCGRGRYQVLVLDGAWVAKRPVRITPALLHVQWRTLQSAGAPQEHDFCAWQLHCEVIVEHAESHCKREAIPFLTGPSAWPLLVAARLGRPPRRKP